MADRKGDEQIPEGLSGFSLFILGEDKNEIPSCHFFELLVVFLALHLPALAMAFFGWSLGAPAERFFGATYAAANS